MTAAEAVAIVASRAPCPHEFWDETGSGWAKCANCRDVFRLADRERATAAYAEFQRALDLLATGGGGR